ncbi:MAG: tRNA (N6-threonylcarbamoyladenosine(37)-N6)-methyltransferase TrmO [Clostridia bacterium]|nr:tRNA (N6-threonylcarbamoyladenosine(37)-N6)-methyltransferase TrmO [Clostridia bacterium]
MEIIAHIHNDFPTKFALPRQSGLVSSLTSKIVFTPKYRVPEAIRGIEEFSHLWIIWEFDQAQNDDWKPTVRPPRLGGNKRVGVFATRSPFRPNSLGLTCVKLERVEQDGEYGDVLIVSGADIMDGTPIYDIKPYIPYADSRPDAIGSFADDHAADSLEVDISKELLNRVAFGKRDTLIGVLSQDPRPAYQDDPERIYGFDYAGYEVKFKVKNSILSVVDILEKPKQ